MGDEENSLIQKTGFAQELASYKFNMIKEEEIFKGSGGSGCGSDESKCKCSNSGTTFNMIGQGNDNSLTGLIFSCSFKVTFPDKASCTCRYHVHIPYSGRDRNRLDRDNAGCGCFTTDPEPKIPGNGHDFTVSAKATEKKHVPQDKEVTLRLMNYNVFGRWLNLAGFEGQTERLKAIP